MRLPRRFSGVAILFVAMVLTVQALLSGIAFPASTAHAQTGTRAQTPASSPIGQLLNSDGTLNLTTGFNGSLDPSGYKMQAGPNGEPRFVPLGNKKGPAPAGPDDNWDARFGFKGLNDAVFAITISGDSIYVGGAFTATKDGSVILKHIARWSKSEGTWYAMGSGLNSSVKAILVAGGVVYAGGLFTASGDNTQVLTHVAMFQGGSWQPMSGGLGDEGSTYEEVRALVAGGNYIYAAGRFTEACIELCWSLNHIAFWDPASETWNPIDNGVDNSPGIYDMAMSSSGILYIVGIFNHAGSLPANDIAYLVGGHWYPLGNPGGPVYSIAISGNGNNETIYIGGSISGVNYACCVAKWNHSTLDWDFLMDGINAEIGWVTDMATSGSDLYVSGQAGLGSSDPHIVKWNGSAWSNVGNSDGISGCSSYSAPLEVEAITISGSDIYAGGCFANVSGLAESVDNIAKWNTSDSKWLGMNGGMNGIVNAVLVRGANVYVGGSFSEAGGIKANNIAKYDGTRWSSLAGGVNGLVNALALSPDGSRLYAGGTFTIAGGTNGLLHVPANRVATLDLRCQGCAWESLGTGAENGLDNTVNGLAASNSYVYVGGQFANAGTHSAPKVAMWSLSAGRWYSLAGGLNDTVYALSLSGNDLYAGGKFTQTLSPVMSVSRMARWNTVSGVWSPLGYSWSNGVNGTVNAIAISGSNVYAGGTFTQAMGVNATNIARWNGSAWSALAGGLDGTVYALATVGTKVYAGGTFSGKIDIWDGASWLSLGSGIGGSLSGVKSLSANSATGDLYVGGLFVLAGNKSSWFIGLYHGQP